MKLCECGCGQPAPIATESGGGYKRGEPKRFVCGHATKGRNLPPRNGGLSSHGAGRTQICCRDGSKVFFYRAVMEAHLGRHLESHEIVHHINGDSSDDRLENLAVTTQQAHTSLHHRLDDACRRGHPRTPENTYESPGGQRQCIPCRKLRESS